MASPSSARLALLVALLVAPRAAVAGDRCEPGTLASLIDVRYGLEPAPRDRLGLELLVRGIELSWGAGCEVRRHTVQLTEAVAPDYGRPEQAVVRLGTYRLGWQGDGWTAYLGVRAAVRWGGHWRFATPVAGGSLSIGRALVRAELDLGGLSLLGLDARLARRRTDLTLEASAVWPAQAATRGEVRLTVHDLAMGAPDGSADVDDVTITAGAGLARAARDHLRALPGFVGLGARPRDGAALIVVEWNLGVATP